MFQLIGDVILFIFGSGLIVGVVITALIARRAYKRMAARIYLRREPRWWGDA